MSKKILPIKKNPMIRGYLHHAYHFCILETEYERTAPWIYNNYIQLTYRTSSPAPLDYYQSWDILTYAFTWKQFDKEVIGDWKNNLTNFIKNRIDNGYYLWFWTNEYYIPNRPAYKVKDFTHSLLIYGYDTDSDTYNVIGFTDTSDFRATTVTGKELVDSAPVAVSYLRICDDADFKIHPKLIASTIEDYLHPEKIQGRYYMWVELPESYSFGMDAVRRLNDEVLAERDGKAEKDFRKFHILWENKTLMLERIKYLLEKGIMSDSSLLDAYEPIVKEAASLKRHYFRFFCSDPKNPDYKTLADSIIQRNNALLEHEKEVLPRVIRDIKETCGF